MTPPAGIIKHPAWNGRDKGLRCHICQTLHQTEADYDVDFLRHDPTAEQGYRWLSAHSYIRVAAARGWPPAGEL